MTGLLILLLVVVGIVLLVNRRSRPQVGPATLLQRVEFLERRVLELQDAVDKLRGTPRPAPAEPEPKPKPEPKPAPPPARAAAPPPRPAAPPPPRPAPTTLPGQQRVAARSFDWARTASAADLMGAKAL